MNTWKEIVEYFTCRPTRKALLFGICIIIAEVIFGVLLCCGVITVVE